MMRVVLFSTLAIPAGFALDLALGDPPGIPHLVRFMGSLIAALEAPFRRAAGRDGKGPASLRRAGAFFTITVLLVSAGIPLAALAALYRFFLPAAFVLETLLIWQCIAVRDLRAASMAVYRRLMEGDLARAREAVGRIVGRDTVNLDAAGVARAAVETVAENTGDGVASPLFFIMFGGAAAGCFYKAVNTMDSMVGYKNARYIDFGRFAAKLDDACNFIPARLCALLMIAAAFLLRLDGRAAARVWKRDRRNHESPNSAQTESACAGALGLRLAGPAFYEGKLEQKPWIGDGERPAGAGDIVRANRLLYGSAILLFILVMGARLCVMAAIYSVTGA
ncbi:MAG: adenosylcobinamide-phosphate synthase CbiB [Spirochaetaceae bacterium]|jgi:adenosylcobinamide-phosphate synthase|nr:adenosylcobinamide-phosphate synthase CbiB [Spirochaetaceae bacterium]